MRRIALCAVFAGAVLGWMTLHVADWLVVEDPLQPAVAIAVLAGKMPFRVMEAAKLYRSGYASEIWLPGPEGPAEHDPIERMGFSPYESAICYRVLEAIGVPRGAVRLLRPEGVKNTREEVAVAIHEFGGLTARLATTGHRDRKVVGCSAELGQQDFGKPDPVDATSHAHIAKGGT